MLLAVLPLANLYLAYWRTAKCWGLRLARPSNIWLYIGLCTPAGRAIFHIPAKFPGLFDFGLYHEIQYHGPGYTYGKVKEAQPRCIDLKYRADGLDHTEQLFSEVGSRRHAIGCAALGEKPKCYEIREIWKYIFLDFLTYRSSFTASLTCSFCFGLAAICSTNCRS